MPRLSIIVPVYNSEAFLSECVDSVLGQTFTDFELLLIDDGSTDSSGAIADLFAAADPRVLVFHESNAGQAAARNLGLDRARGSLLAFIDSDDRIDPDTFASAITALDLHPEADFVQFPFEKDGILHAPATETVVNDPDQIFRLWINDKTVTNYLWDKVWRKELFDGLRMKQGIIFEDRHIAADLFSRARAAVLSPSGRYHYLTHAGQTTARRRDKFFLDSMLTADLHILRIIPRNNTTQRHKVARRLFSTFIERQHLGFDSSMAEAVYKALPSAVSILIHGSGPLRMILFKLLGPQTYYRLLQ